MNVNKNRIQRGRAKLWMALLAVTGVGLGAVPALAQSNSVYARDDRDNRPEQQLREPAAGQAGGSLDAPVLGAASYATVDAAIQAVRQARDLNQALDAYSSGLKLDRDNVALQEAYIQRVVELGSPQVAEASARRLVGVNPDSPLAWAVIAFAEARRGNMPDALTNIALAGRKLPNDPFVEQTAGEMLAWYDNAQRKPNLSDGVKQDLETMRRGYTGQQAFAQAYSKASDFYKNPPQPEQAAQAPSEDQPAPSQPDNGVTDQGPVATGEEISPRASAVYSDSYTYSAPAYEPAPAYVQDYTPYYSAYDPYYAGGYYYAEPAYVYTPTFVYLGGDWGWYGGGRWYHHYDHYDHWRDYARHHDYRNYHGFYSRDYNRGYYSGGHDRGYYGNRGHDSGHIYGNGNDRGHSSYGGNSYVRSHDNDRRPVVSGFGSPGLNRSTMPRSTAGRSFETHTRSEAPVAHRSTSIAPSRAGVGRSESSISSRRSIGREGVGFGSAGLGRSTFASPRSNQSSGSTWHSRALSPSYTPSRTFSNRSSAGRSLSSPSRSGGFERSSSHTFGGAGAGRGGASGHAGHAGRR